jgi:hypothetical protein
MSYPQTPRDDLECLVYCLFEMEHPTLRLPWNRDLTTNEEAKDGWSMRQLERMSKNKEQAWRAACKRVRCGHYHNDPLQDGCTTAEAELCLPVAVAYACTCTCQLRSIMLAGALASYAASCSHTMYGTCANTQKGDADMLCPACTRHIEQGEVPDYLIGYFNYITSLGPLDVPDYEWLEMQLDSGATGLEPPRAPIRRQLADWPSTGETYSRKDYAMVSTCACT